MSLPSVNLQCVEFLQSTAGEKISRFQKKVQRIEQKIRDLEFELEAVTAMVTYLSLHDKRAALVGLFYEVGEYGTAKEEDKEILKNFEDRKHYLEQCIPMYQEHGKKRKSQIEFMQNDLVLLEKIKGINNLSVWRDALNIDV